MPIFRVTVRQDAWVNHETLVEAENEEAAADEALRGWKEGGLKFVKGDVSEYDNAECDESDAEPLEPEDLDAYSDEELAAYNVARSDK